MKILLVTSWDTPHGCGIEAHSRLLIDAVTAADPGIEIVPSSEALDPARAWEVWTAEGVQRGRIHLNFHRALHSRWTPEWVKRFQDGGAKVIITFHDTFGERDPDPLSYDLCATADAFVVHEPCEGLERALYWRMGVPAAAGPYQFGKRYDSYRWNSPDGPCENMCPEECFKQYWTQPILGSLGFPFAWKNYEALAQVTADMGWALLLLAPTATPAQTATWRGINPDLYVRSGFVPQTEAVSLLTGCDATAFCYTCANSGQSGAILQGIAARKPVIAFSGCRQFRSLYEDPLAARTIRWAGDFKWVRTYLETLPLDRVDTGMVALAHQDSWATLGAKYAALYRSLLA